MTAVLEWVVWLMYTPEGLVAYFIGLCVLGLLGFILFLRP
jgi:hypothetical protein